MQSSRCSTGSQVVSVYPFHWTWYNGRCPMTAYSKTLSTSNRSDSGFALAFVPPNLALRVALLSECRSRDAKDPRLRGNILQGLSIELVVSGSSSKYGTWVERCTALESRVKCELFRLIGSPEVSLLMKPDMTGLEIVFCFFEWLPCSSGCWGVVCSREGLSTDKSRGRLRPATFGTSAATLITSAKLLVEGFLYYRWNCLPLQ